MIPTVVNERSVRSFWFYRDGYLCEGIRYGNTLYRLVNTFGKHEEESAYSCCSHLLLHASADHPAAILTVSSQQYRLWAELRIELPVEAEVAVQYA
ncbi:hypothetical protein [Leptolyngbya sp. O-77]|uniref:hypothetical protein n=1 Tax=Leptolyngbya sp. O-77 TaxID=1080068 RepID=UPI00074D4860|nr:hypothetical protein [Leptolyngbya sp. O-77]BAU41112.1 hypothetical protein O77CONTIG1_00919 [Leptolyngbya sp. O-77]